MTTQNQIVWTEEYQSAQEHTIDLGLMAAYVVAAIVGSICIAFLVISFSFGVHNKLKNRKGMMHNNTTRQTHQEVAELDTSQDAKGPADLTTSQRDASLSVTAEEILQSVVDSAIEASSQPRGQADSGCCSGKYDSVSLNHSIEDGDRRSDVSEATASDKSPSPSPKASQLLALTVNVADASYAQSNAVDASKSCVSTLPVQASPMTERVSTFV